MSIARSLRAALKEKDSLILLSDEGFDYGPRAYVETKKGKASIILEPALFVQKLEARSKKSIDELLHCADPDTVLGTLAHEVYLVERRSLPFSTEGQAGRSRRAIW